MSRVFHLQDFPEDKIRVLFKNHQAFVDQSIAYFGSLIHLAQFLSVSSNAIRQWKKYNIFIPLIHIKRIVAVRELDWFLIEKSVLAYKGPNLSLIVNNPKLPIKESSELFAIIAHLIGDGSVNKNGIPMYINSSRELIDNFDALIRKVFGDIDAKLYQRKDDCYNYTTSKVIADLLYHFYQSIDFDSLTARFPSYTLQMSKPYLASIIRAITDDEGNIRDSSIAIRMKNKQIIDQIKQMLMILLGKDSVYSVKPSDLGMYEVDVRSEYLSLFQKKIKLVHPDKQYDLAQSLKRIQYRKKHHRGYRWETKMKILRILSNRKYTIRALSEQFLVTKSNLYQYLLTLTNDNLVKKVKKQNLTYYVLTPAGFSFLQERDFREGQKKFDNFTFRNRDVLIRLDSITRERLFWFLLLVYGTENRIGARFNVHYNTVNNWKYGKTLIPAKVLNRVLILLSRNGVNITQEINQNIREIRTINGRYPIQEE